MLVLVLILVVIALVLLLAGWFLHLVVLAWTSVGISVLAGLVLLYDWWQTRSAVRAGRQQGGLRDGDGDRDRPGAPAGAVGAGTAGTAGAAGAGPDPYGGADMEPATQVLPIVPSAANAAEQTVVMPVVAPSGSSEAPSGASRSSGLSSRSVTDGAADEGASSRTADAGTTAVDPAAGPEPGGGGDPAAGSAPPGDAGSDRVRDAGSDAAGAARAHEPAGEPATTTGSAGEAPAGAGPASGAGGAGGAFAAGAAVAGGAAGAAGATAAGRPEDGTSRTDRASGAGEEPTSVAAATGGTPPAEEDRTRSAERIDTSGEAPEEPRDQAHASLVARLPDEVVVIDEHPRYHVQACPSLPGQAIIPLPVSEAVELGFTPCGWCSPNRVLSERHPAEAR